jgi:hypothetical protein
MTSRMATGLTTLIARSPRIADRTMQAHPMSRPETLTLIAKTYRDSRPRSAQVSNTREQLGDAPVERGEREDGLVAKAGITVPWC